MRARLAPLLLVLAASAALPASAAEPYQTLLDTKADMLVSVKFVLTVSFGGGREQEGSGVATGVLVDKNGLVMINNSAVGGGGGSRFRGMEFKATPSDFRVTFPGDTKEYPAILGASDSKVGLAFLRIKDLEGKEIHPLAVDASADPAIGDVLYGVSRLPQGFDFAPWVADVRVSGKIQKPRELWNIEGAFTEVAHPLFTKDGVVTGIVVSQEGVGGGGNVVALLPWKTAVGTIQRANKASDTALEEAKKKEAEAAKEPEKAGGAPSEKPGDAPGDKPGDKPSDDANPHGR